MVNTNLIIYFPFDVRFDSTFFFLFVADLILFIYGSFVLRQLYMEITIYLFFYERKLLIIKRVYFFFTEFKTCIKIGNISLAEFFFYCREGQRP